MLLEFLETGDLCLDKLNLQVDKPEKQIWYTLED